MRRKRNHDSPSRSFPAAADGFESSSFVRGQTLPATYSVEAYGVWFLEFLRLDLSTLTVGQQLNVRADLWAFANPELVADYAPPPGPDWLPSMERVAALQLESREQFARLLAGKSAFQLEKGIAYCAKRFGERLIKGDRKGTLEDFFRASVIDTLQTVYGRLYRCPVCQHALLKIGKQKYCSRKCASRAHWEAFAAERPERDHHREYVQRARKRVGPKVVVRKRSTK